MHDHAAFGHRDLLAVEFDLDHGVSSRPARARRAARAGCVRRRQPESCRGCGAGAGPIGPRAPAALAARCGATNSSRKCLIIARTGIAAASPSAQMVRPWMLSATELSRSMSSSRPWPLRDALDHAVEPAGALAARRALAADSRACRSTTRRSSACTMQRVVVHDDDRARAEHRAGLGDRVVVHRQLVHHHVRRQHRRRRAAGDHRLQRAPFAHAAGQLEQLRERRAERHLVVAGLAARRPTTEKILVPPLFGLPSSR